MTRTIASFVICSLAASVAVAQTPSAPIARTWRITSGLETVAIRDVARTGIPVDASPTEWRGRGFDTQIVHSRTRGRRTHDFSVGMARVSDFVYDAGLTTSARPSSERFTRVEGAYEYRRRLWTDMFLKGLDFSAGLRGGASRVSITRDMDGGLRSSDTRLAGEAAFVLGLGFSRSDRFAVDVSLANAAHVGRIREQHSASPDATRTRGGGGWRTDVRLGTSIGLTRALSLRAEYLRRGEGHLSSHRSYTTAHRGFLLGVSHVSR